MIIDRASDIENLIRKGIHVIVDSFGIYAENITIQVKFSIDDLKNFVRTAVNSQTTITIRYAYMLDLRDLDELASIGGGNIVLDFSSYR